MTDPITIDAIAARLGGRTAIARICGLAPATPYSWTRVPPEHVPAIAGALGVAPIELRPDLPQLFGGPVAHGENLSEVTAQLAAFHRRGVQ